jgi:hypothetical protein
MGTTPIFGFPYPDPSDLVANYPALGQQLAEDVEDEIIAASKIKQIVRATDVTNRTTTSATYVDVTGMSVTITPQAATSTVLIILAAQFVTENNTNDELRGYAQITDSSNNTISGAQELAVGPVGFAGNTLNVMSGSLVIFAYATPATTSAVTYKVRFKGISPNSVQFKNATSTGQLYALELA